MPDLMEDKKELATTRLLEVLRGDSNDENVQGVEERLGLSDEEQSALTRTDTVDSKSELQLEIEPDKSKIILEYVDLVKLWILGFFKPQRDIIGFDIGSDSIKYVHFIKEKHGFVLKDMGIRKVEEHYTGDPQKKIENIKNAINNLLTDEIKRSCTAAITIYGQNVSIKKIQLPKMPKKEIRDAIIWNANKDLPFSAENAEYDYKILGTTEDQGIEKTEILVAVVDKALINEQVGFFESLSINLSKVLAIPLSIYNNFYHFIDGAEHANGVVIDFGSKMTNMIFINDGLLQFAREISIGGADITDGMMGTLSGNDGVVKIDREEAERLKFVYGIPNDDDVATTEHGISLNQIASVMRPTLERLLVQIQRSFDFYRSKFPSEEPEKVYITGGTSLLKNIDSFLADGLEKEVILLDPLKNIVVDRQLEEEKSVSEVAPSLAVAVGSALSDEKGINLLPQELKEKIQSAFQKKILMVAAVVTISVISLLSFSTLSEHGEIEAELTQMNANKGPGDELQAQYRNYSMQISQVVNEKHMETENYEAFAGTIQINDYLKILSMVTPSHITLESVIIDLDLARNLTITGILNLAVIDINEANFYLSDYVRQLGNSPLFTRVNPYIVLDQDDFDFEEGDSADNLVFEIICSVPETTRLN